MSALVLLPGMDGTGRLFEPLLDCLPANIEPIVVRYPDRPSSYGEHVQAARRELPRDRPYVVLGESFSGPVAVMLASAAPPNLLGVILCASFLTSPSPWLRLLRPLIPLASPKLAPKFLAHHALLGRFATPALEAAHTQALREVSARTLGARLRAMAELDLRETMIRLDLPTLYLRATEDRVVAARLGEEYLACARNGRIEDIEAPHFLLQSRPGQAACAIVEFMIRLSARMSS